MLIHSSVPLLSELEARISKVYDPHKARSKRKWLLVIYMVASIILSVLIWFTTIDPVFKVIGSMLFITLAIYCEYDFSRKPFRFRVDLMNMNDLDAAIDFCQQHDIICRAYEVTETSVDFVMFTFKNETDAAFFKTYWT